MNDGLDNKYSNSDNSSYSNQYGYNGQSEQSFVIKSTIARKDADTYVKWGKILGIIIIIQGAFQCLTCFGAIIGVPYIMAGLKFHKSAQSLERSLLIGDESTVMSAFHDIAEGTKIMGILLLVGIILGIVLMIVYIALLPIIIKEMENEFRNLSLMLLNNFCN